MVKGLAHICVGAADLSASARFYTEALGMRRAFDFKRGGQVVGHYFAFPAGGFVEVFRQDAVDPETRAPLQHVCLEVEDLDGVIARLRGMGCKVSDKRLGADRAWQAWTADPSGVRIEFHEYTAASSQRSGSDCALD